MGHCLHPITINSPNLHYNPVSASLRFRPRTPREYLLNAEPCMRKEITVPCGKCVECLKNRQSDFAARCAREAEKRGSMEFVTLTYDDKSLPLGMTLYYTDKSTGETWHDRVGVVNLPRPFEKSFNEFASVARSDILSTEAGRSPRYHSYTIFENDDCLYYAQVTPSLYREDVKRWLKRCRIHYKREHGSDLDFSYAVVGEYGPNTCRPHYHICFFGLSHSQVLKFASEWKFGFTSTKSVNAVNPDGSPGFVIAAKYLGKYVTKGKFECESVKCQDALKNRLCCSIGFGCDLPDSLVSYYRCYDLFGVYDIDTCKLASTGKLLNDEQFKVLFNEVKKRASFNICGQVFPLPVCLSKKLWYVEDDGKIRSSTIRAAFSAVKRDSYTELYLRQLHESTKNEPLRVFRNQALEFLSVSESIAQSEDLVRSEVLQKFYNSSIF